MHGSLVTSSLIRETTENESANEGYRFGQEEETYNIVAVWLRNLSNNEPDSPRACVCNLMGRFLKAWGCFLLLIANLGRLESSAEKVRDNVCKFSFRFRNLFSQISDGFN
jgi:hypothetical protein